MGYVILISALLVEVVGTSLLKYSQGLTRPIIGFSAYLMYAVSIYLFSVAIRSINLAVADTIWQGLGIVLIALVSNVVFSEKLNVNQIAFMIVTIIGVIGIGLG